ncbi:pentapeptide repeat-containing protein [Myxosarcina sp. GI1]|uniref:pentapeptide repeat-containing protein n=1 Tax=Myxosarcina sp. GI1 TaxID=1541065 RepID=UPI000561C760|nr:pentapeptide repeat-containing protein [Myxosarcina sp. GI1]
MIGISTSTEFSPDKLLAELIKKIRSANELTQESFGQLFEPSVTQSTVARWEKGEQRPDRIHFPKIAALIDFSFEELLELLENPLFDLDGVPVEKKILTPNKKHLQILKRGVKVWNQWRDKNKHVTPELAGADLTHYTLDEVNLDRADLRGAKLSHFSACNSSFKYANFCGANLNQAYFNSANLNGANFTGASLRFTYFTEAKLTGIKFQQTTLSALDFTSANLSKANFDRAKIIRTDFREANCNRASFDNTDISDSLVYGASFWETNFNETKAKDIYIAPNGRERLPIKEIASAQIVFLHRYQPSITQKFLNDFQLEKEAIKLASIIVDKYGDYSHTYGFREYCNINETDQIPPYHEIRRYEDRFFIKVIPDFRDRQLVWSGEASQKIILEIIGGITESNLSSNDIDNLKQLAKIEAERQKQRVDILAPLAVEVLNINKNNKFVNQDYIVEKINKEIILRTTFEADIELMRVYFYNKQWNIVNSSLSVSNIRYFQKLLDNMKSQPIDE